MKWACLFYFAGLFGQDKFDYIKQSLGYSVLTAQVAALESGFNPDAVSHADARGLMQLTPIAVKDIYDRIHCNQDIPTQKDFDYFNPDHSLAVGFCYLEHLLQLNSGNVWATLISYNAGMSYRHVSWNKLPKETQQYLIRYTKHKRCTLAREKGIKLEK